MTKVKYNVRNTEADSLSDAIVRIYQSLAADSAVASDAYLKEVMTEVESRSAAITTAIKTDKASSTLDEADAKRDEIIKQLNAALTGYANLPIPAFQTAAASLLAITAKYKGIASESYARESSLISSLLEDLGADSAKEAISALQGVGDLVSALTTAQDEFNKTNDAYNAASANKSKSATSLKKPLLSAINDKLVPYLTAMALANKATYGDFVSKVENEITRANAAVAKRSKSGATDTASDSAE